MPAPATPLFSLSSWMLRAGVIPFFSLSFLSSLRGLGKPKQFESLYIMFFSRKDYQTGLLRFARNDEGGGQTGLLRSARNDVGGVTDRIASLRSQWRGRRTDRILWSSPKMTKEKRCHPELVSGSHYSIYPLVFVCKIYEMPKQVRHDNLVCVGR